jgi:hypothetical protein
MTVNNALILQTLEDMLDETITRYFNKEASFYELKQDMMLWSNQYDVVKKEVE